MQQKVQNQKNNHFTAKSMKHAKICTLKFYICFYGIKKRVNLA